MVCQTPGMSAELKDGLNITALKTRSAQPNELAPKLMSLSVD